MVDFQRKITHVLTYFPSSSIPTFLSFYPISLLLYSWSIVLAFDFSKKEKYIATILKSQKSFSTEFCWLDWLWDNEPSVSVTKYLGCDYFVLFMIITLKCITWNEHFYTDFLLKLSNIDSYSYYLYIKLLLLAFLYVALQKMLELTLLLCKWDRTISNSKLIHAYPISWKTWIQIFLHSHCADNARYKRNHLDKPVSLASAILAQN